MIFDQAKGLFLILIVFIIYFLYREWKKRQEDVSKMVKRDLADNQAQMPNNWDNHDAWEIYYASLPSDNFQYKSTITNPGSFSFDRLGSVIDDLQQRNRLTLWFPGCGFSPLPRIFASFGFTVYATDIAQSAVNYQSSNHSIIQPLLSKIKVTYKHRTKGLIIPFVHDFRSEFDSKVDAIFNIKAIQALPPKSMKLAIRSHFLALHEGGIAFFDTMNVQGERCNQLEQMLVDAGFYVPLFKLNQWYRNTLTKSNIPHVFILGNPMLQQTGDYQPGTTQYNDALNIL